MRGFPQIQKYSVQTEEILRLSSAHSEIFLCIQEWDEIFSRAILSSRVEKSEIDFQKFKLQIV